MKIIRPKKCLQDREEKNYSKADSPHYRDHPAFLQNLKKLSLELLLRLKNKKINKNLNFEKHVCHLQLHTKFEASLSYMKYTLKKEKKKKRRKENKERKLLNM